MSLTGKIIISLLVAAAASTVLSFYHQQTTGGMVLFAVFSAATIATALLTSIKIDMSTATASPAQSNSQRKKTKQPRDKKPAKPTAVSNSAKREEGEVKWFNVTKGFGFISRESGEEIFVHFRSIRGEGRRSLRDGQRVTFVVSDSDKGPQAEDVEGLD